MSCLHDTPSEELLKAVRAAFVMQGTSLHAWCSKQGVHRQNVSKALTGSWSGPKATALVQEVVKASRLKVPE